MSLLSTVALFATPTSQPAADASAAAAVGIHTRARAAQLLLHVLALQEEAATQDIALLVPALIASIHDATVGRAVNRDVSMLASCYYTQPTITGDGLSAASLDAHARHAETGGADAVARALAAAQRDPESLASYVAQAARLMGRFVPPEAYVPVVISYITGTAILASGKKRPVSATTASGGAAFAGAGTGAGLGHVYELSRAQVVAAGCHVLWLALAESTPAAALATIKTLLNHDDPAPGAGEVVLAAAAGAASAASDEAPSDAGSKKKASGYKPTMAAIGACGGLLSPVVLAEVYGAAETAASLTCASAAAGDLTPPSAAASGTPSAAAGAVASAWLVHQRAARAVDEFDALAQPSLQVSAGAAGSTSAAPTSALAPTATAGSVSTTAAVIAATASAAPPVTPDWLSCLHHWCAALHVVLGLLASKGLRSTIGILYDKTGRMHDASVNAQMGHALTALLSIRGLLAAPCLTASSRTDDASSDTPPVAALLECALRAACTASPTAVFARLPALHMALSLAPPSVALQTTRAAAAVNAVDGVLATLPRGSDAAAVTPLHVPAWLLVDASLHALGRVAAGGNGADFNAVSFAQAASASAAMPVPVAATTSSAERAATVACGFYRISAASCLPPASLSAVVPRHHAMLASCLESFPSPLLWRHLHPAHGLLAQLCSQQVWVAVATHATGAAGGSGLPAAPTATSAAAAVELAASVSFVVDLGATIVGDCASLAAGALAAPAAAAIAAGTGPVIALPAPGGGPAAGVQQFEAPLVAWAHDCLLPVLAAVGASPAPAPLSQALCTREILEDSLLRRIFGAVVDLAAPATSDATAAATGDSGSAAVAASAPAVLPLWCATPRLGAVAAATSAALEPLLERLPLPLTSAAHDVVLVHSATARLLAECHLLTEWATTGAAAGELTLRQRVDAASELASALGVEKDTPAAGGLKITYRLRDPTSGGKRGSHSSVDATGGAPLLEAARRLLSSISVQTMAVCPPVDAAPSVVTATQAYLQAAVVRAALSVAAITQAAYTAQPSAADATLVTVASLLQSALVDDGDSIAKRAKASDDAPAAAAQVREACLWLLRLASTVKAAAQPPAGSAIMRDGSGAAAVTDATLDDASASDAGDAMAALTVGADDAGADDHVPASVAHLERLVFMLAAAAPQAVAAALSGLGSAGAAASAGDAAAADAAPVDAALLASLADHCETMLMLTGGARP